MSNDEKQTYLMARFLKVLRTAMKKWPKALSAVSLPMLKICAIVTQAVL
jgi:hypothetical protein